MALRAPYTALCTATSVLAMRSTLPLSDLARQCPLERDASDPRLFRRRSAAASAENDSCCSGGGLLYNCDAFDFIVVGDEVKVMQSYEDIPKGSVGIVQKLEPPHAEVKFGKTAWTLEISDLRRKGIPAAGAPDSNSSWTCSCHCEAVEVHMDIVRYAVEEQDSRHFRVWADLEPKAEHAEKGRVLFLYPESDGNNAFAFREQLCSRMACWQQRGFAVSLRVVGNISAANRVLEHFGSKSLSHVVLGGHGNPRGITWGKGDEGKLKVGDRATELFLFALREKLLISGSVTLDACETARDLRGTLNFFEFAASKLPGRRVIGATVKLKTSMWKPGPDSECLSGDTVIFVENGTEKMRIQQTGKPNCKEMPAAQVQASAKAGGLCLTRCRETCWMAWWGLSHKGVFGNLSVSLVIEPGEDAGINPCNPGRKTLCRMSVK
mmetsp:Transcript_42454/g.98357  ORF Transcript_42454/g.98357 Transcript_42454/m.98357 type:complete len:437 (+) Transcript_42454:37-1347(+)|eukprot:CAMPEP_0171071846 /NCGR_PEP_ID=MMETSP0766_2-20121228/10534_1 /TAXON_ID=439317 /ORGANISM="Gambierdiscus australes, Strain CAWD 149" /LENGTH=436 /DNA_ID=CAMNT_0011528399 /DNA_START=32 /DNA_END=1342 /DNA_ORIENTATION=+